jgi:hypothetical protein
MDFRKLSENDLADFAERVSNRLSGAELTAIDERVRTALIASIGTLPTMLATRAAEAARAEDVRKAAVSARNDTRVDIVAVMAQVRDALRAGLAPREQYDLCGFDYPLTKPSTYVAQDPSGLSVFGYSNGLVRGKFKGNNKAGQVVYQIWRRHGDDGPWGMHITTRRQSFADTPVTPGQIYEYKVRAVAAKSVSHFSNSAVVYGME